MRWFDCTGVRGWSRVSIQCSESAPAPNPTMRAHPAPSWVSRPQTRDLEQALSHRCPHSPHCDETKCSLISGHSGSGDCDFILFPTLDWPTYGHESRGHATGGECRQRRRARAEDRTAGRARDFRRVRGGAAAGALERPPVVRAGLSVASIAIGTPAMLERSLLRSSSTRNAWS